MRKHLIQCLASEKYSTHCSQQKGVVLCSQGQAQDCSTRASEMARAGTGLGSREIRVGLGVEGGMGTRTGKEMESVAKKHSSGRGKLL